MTEAPFESSVVGSALRPVATPIDESKNNANFFERSTKNRIDGFSEHAKCFTPQNEHEGTSNANEKIPFRSAEHRKEVPIVVEDSTVKDQPIESIEHLPPIKRGANEGAFLTGQSCLDLIQSSARRENPDNAPGEESAHTVKDSLTKRDDVLNFNRPA